MDESKNMLPSVAGGETHPNGYGVLNLEAEIPTEDSLTVDVLSTQTGQIVKDIHGNEMTGLTGKIIELWDINSADYTAIDFKFNTDSGTDRLSTPKLHGFNIGTTIGTVSTKQTSQILMSMMVSGILRVSTFRSSTILPSWIPTQPILIT